MDYTFGVKRKVIWTDALFYTILYAGFFFGFGYYFAKLTRARR